jgi:enoyl-CoA hydratase
MPSTQIALTMPQRDMELLKELSREALNSHDAREGRQAFMEKRKAQFLGR